MGSEAWERDAMRRKDISQTNAINPTKRSTNNAITKQRNRPRVDLSKKGTKMLLKRKFDISSSPERKTANVRNHRD